MRETLLDAVPRAVADPDAGLRFLDAHETPDWHSWARIWDEARAVAGRLRAAGIERGERVALVYGTGPAFFHAFFGAMAAGGVPVPLYPPVRMGRLPEYQAATGRAVTASGARLVLAEPRVRRVLGEAMALARPALGCLTLAELPAAPPAFVEGSPDDLALVQFSSGSTVDPKPVALTHAQVCAQARRLLERVLRVAPAGATPTGVSWLPLYHDMGLVGCVFPGLLHPATLTLIPPELFAARPAIWLRAISRYRAVVSPAPNFAYALCAQRVRDDELEGVDLSGWRLALDGAEPVVPGVLRAFYDRFSRYGLRPDALTPVYGLSEAALAVTFAEPDQPFRTLRVARSALADGLVEPDASGVELVSVGRPLPGFAVEVRDEARTGLPEGRVGRIWASGPSIMSGYLGQPEATARVLVEGWLDTGDLGFLHEGELFLCGRAKDVLVLRGRKYAPQDVEIAVDGVGGVRTGCVAAASYLPEDATGGERLVLMVERRDDVGEDVLVAMPEAAAAAVLERTGLRPDEVIVLAPGTLPRTSSGKIRRGEALRQLLAGELRPPDTMGPVRLLGVMARSAWAMPRGSRG